MNNISLTKYFVDGENEFVLVYSPESKNFNYTNLKDIKLDDIYIRLGRASNVMEFFQCKEEKLINTISPKPLWKLANSYNQRIVLVYNKALKCFESQLFKNIKKNDIMLWQIKLSAEFAISYVSIDVTEDMCHSIVGTINTILKEEDLVILKETGKLTV